MVLGVVDFFILRFLFYSFLNQSREMFELELIAAAVVSFGTLNSVAGRIRAKPLGEYDYLVALTNSLLYLIVYSSIWIFRVYTGRAETKEIWELWAPNRQQLATPEGSLSPISLQNPLLEEDRGDEASDEITTSQKSLWSRLGVWKFLFLCGLCDSFGNVMGFIAQPYLSGPLYQLMLQTNIVFSSLCSVAFLGKEFNKWQLGAIGLLLFGEGVNLVPSLRQEEMDSRYYQTLLFAAVAAMGTLPNAVSFVLKEKTFRSNVRSYDLFLINSTTAMFQVLSIPLSLPLNILLGQTKGLPVLQYAKDGFQCFAGSTPSSIDYSTCEEWGCCTYAPYAYVTYVTFNIILNIAILGLIKYGSAVYSFVCMKSILGFSVIAFALVHWPLLSPSDEAVSLETWFALVIILVATVMYRKASTFNVK
eukprot:GHVP01009800.1.p1 GENE.GHVP01009800.1~~GHVP01009800.1.p1  ORF type:complete len:419 (+),score=40.46 GHVP01009800.1:1-1257(+)